MNLILFRFLLVTQGITHTWTTTLYYDTPINPLYIL